MRLVSALEVTKDGMNRVCFKLLGYLALFISCAAALVAILPVIIWFYAGALFNDLMARSDNYE